MSVSPVGGAIYANQNMQIPAVKQADFQQRLDMQTTINMSQTQEKDKIIEEIRPTEESYKVDPDRDDEEKKRHGKHEHQKREKEEKEEEAPFEEGRLDLRI